MAGNSFLQSPFQSLIDRQPAPLPGSDPVPDVEIPDVSAAAPAPAQQPVAAPRATSPASLLPPESMRPLFEATAAHFNVPVNVLMAIAQQESSYDSSATNKDTGAAGMAQYMDATAKSLRINARDPNEAIPAAAQQLRERLDKGYSMQDAVAEHFAGPDRKKWGEKTSAYSAEVLGKAGQIGQQLYGDSADAAPAQPAAGPEQNQFAPDRMARADYEKEFRALNPKAGQGAVNAAMAQYDQKVAARLKSKTAARAAGPMKAIPTPEEFFDQRLNAKLQGQPDGVVPQLPAREQPVAFPETGTPAPRPDLIDQARGDFGRGIDNLRALGYGAAGMAADAAGKDDEATKLLDQYVAIQNDVAKHNPATIGSYKNVHDLGDAGRYTIEAVMENLPMILPSLVTGGVGAQAAKIGAQRLVGGMIESQVAKGIARDVAERNAAQFIARRVMMGSAAGAAPATVGMETGSIGGDIYQDTGQKRPGIALAYGIPAGLLDTLEPVLALRKIAGPVVDEVAGGIIKRLGVEAGKQFIAEAGTEGLQTIIEEAGKSQASGKKLFTPELLDNVIDSALKGGLGGAGMGVMSEATHSARAALAQPQAAVPDQHPRIDPTMGDVPAQVGADPAAAPAPAPAGSSVADQLRAIRPLDAPAFQADDEGFSGQIMGDDGQMHTVDSRTGVSGPLEGAVTHAAAAPSAADAGPMSAAIDQAAAQHEADPAPAPEMPPAPPDYTAMPLEDLRAALKDVAARAQQQPDQRKALMAERRQIEQEIGARGKQAKADSKPAVEPLSAGPFDEMKAANRMMERYAEETGQPHEVVGSEGKFRVQPIGGANGIDTAGTERGTDGRGRSGRPAGVVGRADEIAGGQVDGRTGEPRRSGQRAADAGIGTNPADRAAGADGAGDAAAAVAPQSEIAHVPERPQVPEEAPVARGEEAAQPVAAGVRPAADAGTGAAPTQPEGKLAARRALNDRQDEVVKAAAAKLAARKAEKEPEPRKTHSLYTNRPAYVEPAQKLVQDHIAGKISKESMIDGFKALGMKLGQVRSVSTPLSNWTHADEQAYMAWQESAPQPAAEKAPAPTPEPAREVPRSFMKKVKVDHDVYISDERRWETVKVPAHVALKSVREDIGNLEALLKCMKG